MLTLEGVVYAEARRHVRGLGLLLSTLADIIVRHLRDVGVIPAVRLVVFFRIIRIQHVCVRSE